MWRVQLNVENIFNRGYWATADANNNIPPGQPRTFRLSAICEVLKVRGGGDRRHPGSRDDVSRATCSFFPAVGRVTASHARYLVEASIARFDVVLALFGEVTLKRSNWRP